MELIIVKDEILQSVKDYVEKWYQIIEFSSIRFVDANDEELDGYFCVKIDLDLCPKAGDLNKVLCLHIQELELSARLYNVLSGNGFEFIGQILLLNIEDLIYLRGFGRKSCRKLQDKVSEILSINNITSEHIDEIKKRFFGDEVSQLLTCSERIRAVSNLDLDWESIFGKICDPN